MKKNSLALLTLLSLMIFACDSSFHGKDEDSIPAKDETVNTAIDPTDLKFSKKTLLKQKFGFALVNSLKESRLLRELLKDEALKMFNKDYEVLVYTILNRELEGGATFRGLIAKHSDKDFDLKELLSLEPTLTVMIPELPNNSFSAEIWDAANDVPAIAIRTNETNEVPLITPTNELGIIPGDAIPGFPVLVVKNNERVVSNKEHHNFDMLDTKVLYRDNDVTLKFWSNSFDNKTLENSASRRAYTRRMDKVLLDAWKIYQSTYGWQRDYIYYGIRPGNPNGPFLYNFKEYIRSFSMTGSAKGAYNVISDQSSDPKYHNNHRIGSSHWTDGYYEFQVTTITKNGELTNGFSVNPRKLFDLNYETYTRGWWFWKKTYYRLKSIYNKEVSVNIPIINWSLQKYGASIRIEIEEVDLKVTTVMSKSMTFKIARNVSYKDEKTGLGFGSTNSISQTFSVQRTFTQGSDKLRGVTVNFGDKVIIRSSRYRTYTRDYRTGLCKFSLEPKRVQ